MEKLIEKVDNLIDKIDSLDLINDIKVLSEEIYKDDELLSLIEKYKLSLDKDLKNKIISNDLFRKYKHKETEVNLLIMGINQELGKISGRGMCQK